MPKKLTAYSPAELYELSKTKGPDATSAKSLLKAINYAEFRKKLVVFTKKEFQGKLSPKESKLFEEMQERNLKQYWRMRGWFQKLSFS